MLIRSGETPAIGRSQQMLYSGFITLPRSVIRRQTVFAARITRTLYGLERMADPKNPYRSPSSGTTPTAETRPDRHWLVRYILSWLFLCFLSMLFAPGDNGVWLSWAVTIETAVYLVFLLLLFLVFKGRVRALAIAMGPIFCFFVSVNLVVYWTMAVENGLLPRPWPLF